MLEEEEDSSWELEAGGKVKSPRCPDSVGVNATGTWGTRPGLSFADQVGATRRSGVEVGRANVREENTPGWRIALEFGLSKGADVE